MMEIEKKSKEKELTEEDFPWEPWHAGCYPLGVYTLLFDNREDRIRGVKFTILNQWEEITPMCRKEGAKTEAYILFCQQYDDIIGPLSYEEVEKEKEKDTRAKRNHTLKNEVRQEVIFYHNEMTFTDQDYYGPGRFLRSFQSLSEAKKYALYYARCNYSHFRKKETVLEGQDYKREEYQRRRAYYQAYQLYRKYYKEIIGAISEENCFPDSNCGGGPYLRDAILKRVPEMTKQQLLMIWDDIPLALEKRTQDWITQEKWNCEKKLENGNLMQTDRNTV